MQFSKSYSAAKIDFSDATRYAANSGRRARKAAKRDLARAARRYGKALANAS